MAELVDAPHSKCGVAIRESSSLSLPIEHHLICLNLYFREKTYIWRVDKFYIDDRDARSHLQAQTVINSLKTH